jgi:hypothetical protein
LSSGSHWHARTGDPRLIGDPRVAKLAEDAGSMVPEFHYRDRLEGIPSEALPRAEQE